MTISCRLFASNLFTILLLLLAWGCGGEPEPPPAAGAPPDEGRWHRAADQGAPRLTEEQGDEMARLEAIGYVTGSREAGPVSGVTLHDRVRAGRGCNLYTSGHGPEAVLVDMDGRELHRWRYPCRDIWPPDPGARTNPDLTYWRNALLLPNGDLLAIFEGRGLIRLDRDSNLLWASSCGAHHDLDLDDNGKILVLTRRAVISPLVSEEKPILEDFIATLDAETGEVLGEVSLLRCFANAPSFEAIWRSSENSTGDIFHTNALSILRDPPPGAPGPFIDGRILTSMKCLDAVALVDPGEERVVWARRGRFRGQHDPRLLADGNLLLFDNYGLANRSRVLEMDLHQWRPVWSYTGTPEDPFYSETCGAAQRLANGNTLITETDGGRAFEVTREGDIVWEFRNPHRAGDREQFVASLFVVRRLEPGFPVHWACGAP